MQKIKAINITNRSRTLLASSISGKLDSATKKTPSNETVVHDYKAEELLTLAVVKLEKIAVILSEGLKVKMPSDDDFIIK